MDQLLKINNISKHKIHVKQLHTDLDVEHLCYAI